MRKSSRQKPSKNSGLSKNLSLDEKVTRSTEKEKGLEDLLDAAAQDLKTKKRRRSKKMMLHFESLDISTL